ncbi:diguanylate cyclase [Elizabethkingia anophelis]|uniref:ring-cleaving dioxygenase n=1 Tax=Elizabethkingia TaxID=308865 RepID=UPI00074155E0|nr:MULTISPECIES: ring-cleaving dioxygenase [Elizabethkingia]KUG12668.1 diguanylate cyclase [Elizabethkingia miricola]MCL1657313.1 ring-cleaving dioxygenase [Elizabethkingia miricola]MDX8569789.1 ring-cleaving dioxygenase [Elizabethkingia sp. HX XZB]MDX8573294.1 ring-cleaving dioxygenase [Elizabethkingia sp. HX QKY]OIK47003.1 diguanylate cyclase [Elizabethkingia sp. HvH-WGS333]
MSLITGLHHVTAITGDAQENIDFYTGVLGLRLVKKTVNFDYSEVYHFYFGDEFGTPGTIMTTFPYGKGLVNGRHGKGMLNTTAFSVAMDGLDYWLERLDRFGIPYKQPQERFSGEVFIYLEDYDGLGLELVFNTKDPRKGYSKGTIPVDYAIKGIHHVEIWLASYERTAALLTTQMDHVLVSESSDRFRFATENAPGKYVDLLCTPAALKGLAGRGTVHHVAFATPDAESQLEMMDKLDRFGLEHTEVKDRKYFTSVYFKEPGGVLFEIATSGPGFSVDEELASLGESLMLPKQFEKERAHLEEVLPQFVYPVEKFK